MRNSSEPFTTADPFALFLKWHAEAQVGAWMDRDIMALASANTNAKPSCRMVFYRRIREGGFSFFTNYESRKGAELSENPFAAIVFYWPHLGKQVRIEGEARRLSESESDSYFLQRALQSRVTAAVSRQSHLMPDETEFAARLKNLEQSSRKRPLSRPPHWGGFTIVPACFEFWRRGESRRHWRLHFEKQGEVWQQSRMYP